MLAGKIEAREPSTKGAPAIRKMAGRFLGLLGEMKQYVRDVLPPFPDRGMSEQKFHSLLSMRLLGRSPLKVLASHDGLSASAKCIMLNRLVAEGFAERTEDPGDRRSVFYELTESGLALLNEEIARRTDLLTEGLARLDREEREELAQAIETLSSGITKLRAKR